MDNEFYTFREYMKQADSQLTASMEDYLEMICRLSRDKGYTRVNALATALNVQPPSATKMVQKLADIGLINYEKYGIITPTKQGQQIGNTLLERHKTIENFLRLLGLKKGVLEETEKIEHTVSSQTLEHLATFVNFLKTRPEIIENYNTFQKRLKINKENE
ncbi:DtxR family iron (metal) dependent repressor [Thermincola ferriacetica]|uniref:Manganese transport regulator n=1 Tax=Thermincola ferriacetica TaxID=281456 RepID=A0A0L6W4E6_9FIRM|nr:iron dependent repressor, metal binding and dimerization domain protein [Thermincola ferriacetica]KNZ69959.1 DtxR family iron (metal) dependent repressor [Thermincola ferriacetica]